MKLLSFTVSKGAPLILSPLAAGEGEFSFDREEFPIQQKSNK